MLFEAMDRVRTMRERPLEFSQLFRLFHIHIPKTAGTSFLTVMKDLFPLHSHLSWDNAGQDWRDLCQSGLIRPFNTGHIRLDQVSSEIDLVTKRLMLVSVVREPLDRVISNYNYGRSVIHPQHREFREEYASLQQFVGQATLEPNEQSYWLCGVQNDRAALISAVNRLYFGLCPLPFLDHYMDVIRTTFTDKPHVDSVKVNELELSPGDKKFGREDISDTFIERFYEANALDLELYRSCLHQYAEIMEPLTPTNENLPFDGSSSGEQTSPLPAPDKAFVET